MSEEKKNFSGLLSSLRDGLSKINNEAKADAEGVAGKRSHAEEELRAEKPDDHFYEELDSELEQVGPAPSLDAEIDEAIIIEQEPAPVKPKSGLAAMSGKQKAMIAVGAIGIAFAVRTTFLTPSAPVYPNSVGADMGDFDTGFNVEQDLSLSAPQSEAERAFAIGGYDDGDFSLNEFAGTAASMSDPNALLDDAFDIAMLENEISVLPGDKPEMLDPFSRTVIAAPVAPTLSASIQPEATGEVLTFDLESGADLDNPFGAPVATAPQLSGTDSENPDSGVSELLDQSANANVAALRAELAEKDGRIGKLQIELDKAKQDLVTAQKAKLEEASKQPAQRSVAANPAPAAKPATVQRSTPQLRVARAPARPQICVSAVAQAARNCTTCVPHAFITHKGVETMVGQGDYVEGLRISIVGDRLDLQNSQGEVAHKFWSSPNGCAG